MRVCKHNQYAKRAYSLLAIVLLLLSVNAQINLIPNPSFENNTGIPDQYSQIYKTGNWYDAYGTVDYYTTSSPIVYNSPTCSVNSLNNAVGNQAPRTGNAYAGLILKGFPTNTMFPARQYIEQIGTGLTAPLLKDHVYDFSMYYNTAEISTYMNNRLSAYFSVNQFTVQYSGNMFDPNWWNANFNYIKPQVNHDTTKHLLFDTLNWQNLQGCFIAQGGEKYVAIGNFKDARFNSIQNTNTPFVSQCTGVIGAEYCYLYIDDVSLYDRGYYSGKAKTIRKDTTICFNSPLVIGDNRKDSSQYVWQPAAGLSCTNCPNPVANPSVTTKYTLTKTLCSFVTKDSITVTIYTPTATAKAGNDFTLCLGSNQVVSIGTADSTRFSSYNWQPPVLLTCATCATPSIKGIDLPASTVAFTLLRTECGITTTATVNMTLEDCETTYTVPNIYTPNNDNVNDVWGLQFNQIRFVKGFRLNVYNRWGNVIFESTQPNRKWDARTTSGEPVSAGVYFYTVEFLINDKPLTLKGTVTLLR